jgi:molybdopterin-guanine dinucleotide biosynthesis protein B
MMEEKPTDLKGLVGRMLKMDAIVIEGFKEADYSKVVMIRTAEDIELVHRLRQVIAVVTWMPELTFDIPTFPIQQTDQLVSWLLPKLCPKHDN